MFHALIVDSVLLPSETHMPKISDWLVDQPRSTDPPARPDAMGNDEEISPLCENAKLRDTGTANRVFTRFSGFQPIEAKREKEERIGHLRGR